MPIGLLHKDGTPVPGRRRQDRHLPRHPTASPPTAGPFEATYVPIEGPGIKLAPEDIKGVYVAHMTLPSAGGYFMAAKYTVDGKESTASGSINVAERRVHAAGRRRRAAVRHADDQVHRRRLRGADDRRPARQDAAEYSIADSIEGEEAVRRRVRHAEVLLQPAVRARP